MDYVRLKGETAEERRHYHIVVAEYRDQAGKLYFKTACDHETKIEPTQELPEKASLCRMCLAAMNPGARRAQAAAKTRKDNEPPTTPFPQGYLCPKVRRHVRSLPGQKVLFTEPAT